MFAHDGSCKAGCSRRRKGTVVVAHHEEEDRQGGGAQLRIQQQYREPHGRHNAVQHTKPREERRGLRNISHEMTEPIVAEVDDCEHQKGEQDTLVRPTFDDRLSYLRKLWSMWSNETSVSLSITSLCRQPLRRQHHRSRNRSRNGLDTLFRIALGKSTRPHYWQQDQPQT